MPETSELDLLLGVFPSKRMVLGVCFATGYFQRILKGDFGLCVHRLLVLRSFDDKGMNKQKNSQTL